MTDKTTSTLRPGLLVSLSIRITGNVTYKIKDLERKHRADDGTERKRWETERVVENPTELHRAEKVRAEARHLISKVCARSSFGLLCPNAWSKSLYENITEARRIAAEFNARAKCTEVGVYVIVGRVAQDDVEAVRAINSEVRDLMRDMADGIKNLDVKRVREAAARARSVGMMLTPEAGEKIKAAIDAARASARKLVKAGEQAASAVDKEAIKKIGAARTAFLDLDAGDVLPARPAASARTVDLAPEEPVRKKVAKKTAKKKEMADA